MRALTNRAILLVMVAAGGVSLASCTDEKIIYRERPIYEEPIDAALDFVGYSDPTDPADPKLTVCGNCHIEKQGEWEQTAHAMAWEGLQSSDHAQASCEGCHTVNSFGNVMEETTPGTPEGGWAAVQDERYHDVQCENCHGAGLPHVRDPKVETRPLAPILVGTDLSFGCGECHSGAHHPFVEEWEASPHGNMSAYPASREEDNGGCFFCHSGEGALQRWGVKGDYLEKSQLLGSAEFADLTCAVCHDPHDNTNDHQLRFPVNTSSIENHLCAQCHDRRTEPDPTSSHGLEPHAPEADLLTGYAGWFAPGSSIDQGKIIGTHGSERNTELCATCHVHAYSNQDPATGTTFFSTGHAFRAAPCVDPTTGTPSGAEDCELSTTARSFDGCVSGQCHPSETSVLGVLQSSLISVLDRAQELEDLLNTVDPNGEAAGGAIDPGDPTFTVAEGAFFNLALAHHPTTLDPAMTRADSLIAFMPSTAHNPFLIESLLITSIQAVEREYASILPDVQRNYTPRLTRPPGTN